MPWHSTMSPGLTSSGRKMTSSPTAQLAVLRTTADHVPSCSLTRSESPAQLGQAMMSPERVPSGSSISCPHPLHWTLIIPPSDWAVTEPSAQAEEPLEPAAIKADDGLAVDHGD